jgi:hypothetical protein
MEVVTQAVTFHLHTAGVRRGFLHPVTQQPFASKLEAGEFAKKIRPGSIAATSISRRVQILLLPDTVEEPLSSACKFNTPYMRYSAFVLGESLPMGPVSVIMTGPANIADTLKTSISHLHPHQKRQQTAARVSAQSLASASVTHPWDDFAARRPDLLRRVPLPGHCLNEDRDWCVQEADDVPEDLLKLGRDAWVLAALTLGTVCGVFLPRWAGRLLEMHEDDGSWITLWSWVAKCHPKVTLLFVELGEGTGCCYAFNISAPASIKALFKTLAWHNHAPESFTLFRQHTVLGFSKERISEAYARAGNPRFALDSALHISDMALRQDWGMATDLRALDGFVLHSGLWHRFFGHAAPGTRGCIMDLFPQLHTS